MTTTPKTADEADDEPSDCQSCLGTGIGNPRVERSMCWACNGSGVSGRTAYAPPDEDRCTQKNFGLDLGEDD